MLYQSHFTFLFAYISQFRLACRCSDKAKAEGYPYFALRFWGICLGVKNLNTFRSTSGACATGRFKPCSSDHTEECVGKGNADFIYKVGKILVNSFVFLTFKDI